MTLAKGIYHRARKQIKNSALCPQLILKIAGIWGEWDCFGIDCSPLVRGLWELLALLVFVERR